MIVIFQKSLIGTGDKHEPTCDSNNSSARNSMVVLDSNGSSTRNSVVVVDEEGEDASNQPVTIAAREATTISVVDNTVNITINHENDNNILSQKNNNANPKDSAEKGAYIGILLC